MPLFPLGRAHRTEARAATTVKAQMVMPRMRWIPEVLPVAKVIPRMVCTIAAAATTLETMRRTRSDGEFVVCATQPA